MITESIGVHGMTCQSCVRSVTAALEALPGVQTVLVSLTQNLATIAYDAHRIQRHRLEAAINDMGFEASAPNSVVVTPARPEMEAAAAAAAAATRTVHLEVAGMTCGSCVATIENGLRALPAVVFCKVSLLSERAEIHVRNALVLSDAEVAEWVEQMGFDAKPISVARTGHINLQITGMTCSSCSGTIERELIKLPGITSVSVNLLGNCGTFEYDKQICGIRDIIEAIEGLGFDAALSDMGSKAQAESLQRTQEIEAWRAAFWSTFALALPVSIISMILPMLWPRVSQIELLPGLLLTDLVQLLLTVPVQLGAVGRRFYRSAYKSVSHGAYTMDVLVAIGTSIAFLFSVINMVVAVCHQHHHPQIFFETSTTLITFISLGRWLENSAKAKTSQALSALLTSAPTKAILLVPTASGEYDEREIPTEYVQVHDLLKILPGERLPSDGCVVFGASDVDESLVTGEPLPVMKRAGDGVIGGTVNGSGLLRVRATRVGADTTLSQIVKLMHDAQTSKASIQGFADRVAGAFVPGVLALGVGTFLGWILVLTLTGWRPVALFGDTTRSSTQHITPLSVCINLAISVICVACPCALGLATPTAVMVGTGVGAQQGILIKGAGSIEVADRVTTVVFDKTGTLTEGNMSVVTFRLYHPDHQAALPDADALSIEQAFFHLVGQAETSSEHPIARAIVRFAHEMAGWKRKPGFHAELVAFDNTPGSGIAATLQMQGHTYAVRMGHAAFLEAASHDDQAGGGGGGGTAVPASVREQKAQNERMGYTTILVAINGHFAGLLAVADTLKPEAVTTVRALGRLGIHVVMITGDQQATADVIARECEIEIVHAGVSPMGKKHLVERMQQAGEIVAMIGDGINDSASLAQANMGIAVHGGTDMSVQASDVVLMRPDLLDLVVAIDLSKTIFRRIRLNFLWATLYNLFMIPVAMGLCVPFGVTLPPMVSGMAMSLSSVSVVASSLLLKQYTRP
ncbi:hypothetical protein CXG81DRAFT_13717, partial [Caulochytrium protostelioides]